MCVQLYKQNRYRNTEIKGYVKGVKSSSIYTIRAVMLCISEVLKVHTGPSIQSNVTHVKGVKSAYMALNTEQCYSCQRCQKCIHGPQYRAMLLMSEVSKVHTWPSIQSNVTHVRGVESAYRALNTEQCYSSQYRAMVLMSEVSKVHTWPSIQSNVTHVKGVKSAYMALNTEQCYSCQRCWKCIHGPQYRAMLLISKVLTMHTWPSIQSNVTHVEGVKSAYRANPNPQYRAMLLMSKLSKVAQYIL